MGEFACNDRGDPGHGGGVSQLPPDTSDGPAARFRSLYAECFDPLLGYALRRAASAEDAADVVADTFLVAWRRIEEVPRGESARLWLYGVARRTLANQRRSAQRRTALGDRLRRDLAAAIPDHADAVVRTSTVTAAVAALPEKDREVVYLSVWEGLEPRQIAVVLGVSSLSVRTRRTRIRARLRGVLGNDFGPLGHVLSDPSTLASREAR